MNGLLRETGTGEEYFTTSIWSDGWRFEMNLEIQSIRIEDIRLLSFPLLDLTRPECTVDFPAGSLLSSDRDRIGNCIGLGPGSDFVQLRVNREDALHAAETELQVRNLAISRKVGKSAITKSW